MRTDWTRYFKIGLSQCRRGDDVATVAAAAAFADAALAEQQKREARDDARGAAMTMSCVLAGSIDGPMTDLELRSAVLKRVEATFATLIKDAIDEGEIERVADGRLHIAIPF